MRLGRVISVWGITPSSELLGNLLRSDEYELCFTGWEQVQLFQHDQLIEATVLNGPLHTVPLVGEIAGYGSAFGRGEDRIIHFGDTAIGIASKAVRGTGTPHSLQLVYQKGSECWPVLAHGLQYCR